MGGVVEVALNTLSWVVLLVVAAFVVERLSYGKRLRKDLVGASLLGGVLLAGTMALSAISAAVFFFTLALDASALTGQENSELFGVFSVGASIGVQLAMMSVAMSVAVVGAKRGLNSFHAAPKGHFPKGKFSLFSRF